MKYNSIFSLIFLFLMSCSLEEPYRDEVNSDPLVLFNNSTFNRLGNGVYVSAAGNFGRYVFVDIGKNSVIYNYNDRVVELSNIFHFPRSLASSGMDIYIGDYSGDDSIDHIYRFSFENSQSRLKMVGSIPFMSPVDIYANSNEVWVLSYHESRVYLFNRNLEPINRFYSEGSVKNYFTTSGYPNSLCIYSNTIYVHSYYGLYLYSMDGLKITNYDSGSFETMDMLIGNYGVIYILEYYGDLKKYKDNLFLGELLTHGGGPSNSYCSRGLFFGKNNSMLYVLDIEGIKKITLSTGITNFRTYFPAFLKGANFPTNSFDFTLSEDSYLTVSVLDTNLQEVKQITSNTYFSAGVNTFSWDCKTENGTYASNGCYLLSIVAKSIYSSENYFKFKTNITLIQRPEISISGFWETNIVTDSWPYLILSFISTGSMNVNAIVDGSISMCNYYFNAGENLFAYFYTNKPIANGYHSLTLTGVDYYGLTCLAETSFIIQMTNFGN